jgi:hypothetical protein
MATAPGSSAIGKCVWCVLTCKGEKFADDPTGHPRKCATCHGNGVEVKPGKTLADLQRFVASLKAEDMLAS